MTKKHFFKIVLYYLLIVIGLGLILGGYVWYLNKQNLVRLNLARPNFPFTRYSDAELEKMYSQYPNEKVATVQTPEQTYAKFIEALKRGDVEGVVGNFMEDKKNKYREYLQKSIKENKLNELIERLDKPIYKIESYTALAYYSFQQIREDGDSLIEFIKDIDGIWKIDSL